MNTINVYHEMLASDWTALPSQVRPCHWLLQSTLSTREALEDGKHFGHVRKYLGQCFIIPSEILNPASNNQPRLK